MAPPRLLRSSSILRSSRLLLRPLRDDDAETIFEGWAARPEASRWLTWEWHRSLQETRDYLEGARLANESGAQIDWMIERLEDGLGIGTIGLGCLSFSALEAGYVLAPQAWGRGFASEALKAVIEAAFAEPLLVRVQASCHPDNAASLRVLEKNGFELEGRLRRSTVFPNLGPEPRDALLLSRVTQPKAR